MSLLVVGKSLSLTQNGLCVSVLIHTQATPVTIKRRKKLGYVLALNTEHQSTENLKNMLIKSV